MVDEVISEVDNSDASVEVSDLVEDQIEGQGESEIDNSGDEGINLADEGQADDQVEGLLDGDAEGVVNNDAEGVVDDLLAVDGEAQIEGSDNLLDEIEGANSAAEGQ